MANNVNIVLNPHMVIDDDDHDNHIGPFAAIPDFCGIAQGLMNCPSCHDGCWSSTETRLFCEFFGTSIRVVETVWELIIRDELRPMGGRPEHLLWALYSLKVYPKQALG